MVRRRRGIALLSLLVVTTLGFVAVAVAAPGDSRAEPVPLNQEAPAGPWRITVMQVVAGADATSQVTAANPANEPPADGFSYVLAQIRATNASDRPLAITGDDFALTGSSGLVQRFPGVVAPEPALAGTVEPGATLEGWVVLLAANDEQNLLLLYDSLSIPGQWADRVFALQDGAAVPDAAQPAAAPNDTGKEPDQPAALTTPVVTAEWQVEILDLAQGDDVVALYPVDDTRTTALAEADPQGVPRWLALRVRVTDVRAGGEPSFLSPTAFMLADEQGDAVLDVTTLTPPRPDLSGTYFPGASREGWIVFETPATYEGTIVRFLPFAADSDPRYLAFGDVVEPTTEPETETETDEIAEGSTVVVNDPNVRMRAEPSTDAEIVETLAEGTELLVTGPAETGSGYTWYPVQNPTNGNSGYVAADFLDAA